VSAEPAWCGDRGLRMDGLALSLGRSGKKSACHATVARSSHFMASHFMASHFMASHFMACDVMTSHVMAVCSARRARG